jgi:hypothetical protein
VNGGSPTPVGFAPAHRQALQAPQACQPPQVAGWVFDAEGGHIRGVDQHGQVLLLVAASPLFGPRLAAAFSSALPWSPPTLNGLRASLPR